MVGGVEVVVRGVKGLVPDVTGLRAGRCWCGLRRCFCLARVERNLNKKDVSMYACSAAVLAHSGPSARHFVKASDGLVGPVVKASASRAEGPGFESRLRRDFFGVESYQ